MIGTCEFIEECAPLLPTQREAIRRRIDEVCDELGFPRRLDHVQASTPVKECA
jgi:hypothetical protein